MSRKTYSKRDQEFIFRREKSHCKKCGEPLIFENRRRGQEGAWEMAHRRSHADGGTSHLRNIVALCYPCNLQQGTTSYAKDERGMEYDSTTNKVKSFLNSQLLGDGIPSFNMTGARRSRSMDAELNEFRMKVKTNSRAWVDKKLTEIYPFVKKWENSLPLDSFYLKYYLMYQIIQEIRPQR